MKLLSHVLLLFVMLASRKCQEFDILTSATPPYEWISEDMVDFRSRGDGIIAGENEISDVPEPNITVYRQIEDRDNVIVLCKTSAKMFRMRWQPFDLSVESELNYTIEILECSSLDSSEICVFLVTVSPPASFTCVHKYGLDDRKLHSQTYNFNGPVSAHHEEGVNSFYICFSSFVAVGLFIMTAAVIVTNIRSKAKDTINPTAVANNDYVEA